jgi:hypothetical protein
MTVMLKRIPPSPLHPNIYEQRDTDGTTHCMMDEIVDHKRLQDALTTNDLNGRIKETTKGWKICIKWKDGSLTWDRLATIKEGYPIERAEYAAANQIINNPAFAWWAPEVLKRRQRLLAKVKTRYFRREEKLGIPMPKSVKEDLELDAESGGTSHWLDAIKKAMSVIIPAVRILNAGDKAPVGCQTIPCHMVVDVKSDFTRPPTTQTYASVVTRESVRIGFLYASLNNLTIMSADVQGAYLNAPCKEKVCTVCGPEFGPSKIG